MNDLKDTLSRMISIDPKVVENQDHGEGDGWVYKASRIAKMPVVV